MNRYTSAYLLLSSGKEYPASSNRGFRRHPDGITAIMREYCSGHFSGHCGCNSHPAWEEKQVPLVVAIMAVAETPKEERAFTSFSLAQKMGEMGLGE